MNFAKNFRKDDGDADVRAFMEAMEHGHEELQPLEPQSETDMLVSAIRGLVEVIELTRITQESLKVAAGKTTTGQRREWWPQSFARILIDAGVKCDESRREAVRRYVEIFRDLKRHEEILANDESAQRRQWADCVTRWRRQVAYHEATLSNLGVTVCDRLVGLRFDPLLHEPLDIAVTQNADEVDTIADVRQPLFSWKDENGTTQCVPALVVLYALDKT